MVVKAIKVAIAAILMVTTVAACDPWVPPIGRTELSGNITTTHDGQVLENFNLNGSIRVEHDNVTIRNFSLVSQGGPAIYNLNNENLVVEDCDMDGSGVDAGSAIAEHNYTLRRCHIHDFGEGPRINGNVTIEDSIITVDDSFIAQGAHQDGIQATSGDNVIIRRNVVTMHVDGGNAAIFFGTYPGNNILIEDNVIGGGSFALAVDSRYTNVTIRNNRFITTIDLGGGVVIDCGGWWGPMSLGGVVTEVGNVWHDGPYEGNSVWTYPYPDRCGGN